MGSGLPPTLTLAPSFPLPELLSFPFSSLVHLLLIIHWANIMEVLLTDRNSMQITHHLKFSSNHIKKYKETGEIDLNNTIYLIINVCAQNITSLSQLRIINELFYILFILSLLRSSLYFIHLNLNCPHFKSSVAPWGWGFCAKPCGCGALQWWTCFTSPLDSAIYWHCGFGRATSLLWAYCLQKPSPSPHGVVVRIELDNICRGSA